MTLDDLRHEAAFLPGDCQECDEDGRPMGILLKERFVLTFWADHATKEVRVVRVKRV